MFVYLDEVFFQCSTDEISEVPGQWKKKVIKNTKNKQAEVCDNDDALKLGEEEEEQGNITSGVVDMKSIRSGSEIVCHSWNLD